MGNIKAPPAGRRRVAKLSGDPKDRSFMDIAFVEGVVRRKLKDKVGVGQYLDVKA